MKEKTQEKEQGKRPAYEEVNCIKQKPKKIKHASIDDLLIGALYIIAAKNCERITGMRDMVADMRKTARDAISEYEEVMKSEGEGESQALTNLKSAIKANRSNDRKFCQTLP